ncbi:MAG: 3-oxoacid CoA-transferase subunit A [Bacteroidales bacterium]|jgi:3-oxoadipate CoA-transferase alpha subunit|nr:3-oxoacid CoA-transferase subunit A [Bacteroidales bacterium]MDI3479616.1 3-oxoadipate CoA-transferase, alpha subunit [Rikenellaceae bacterium]
MINKVFKTPKEAIADIFDGATIMIGGFGEAGSPIELIHALIDQGAKNLTIISNNAGSGHVGLAALLEHKRVKKIICSYPKTAFSEVFPDLYCNGEIEVELVPQGTLAERIRCGGAGIPAFYTPTSVGTPLAEGKEIREIDEKLYVLEYALKADFALVKAYQGDRYGNLTYYKTSRNFGPIMCMAAKVTIAQVNKIVEVGDIDPEIIVTPNIFVQRVVEVANPLHEHVLVSQNKKYPWTE